MVSHSCFVVAGFALLSASGTLGVSKGEAQADLDEDFFSALHEGDECEAGAGAGACSLSALQFRGQRQRRRSKGYEAAPMFLEDSGWTKVRRAHPEQHHELAFVLRQHNWDALHRAATELTDPDSPKFRQWMSRADVDRLVRNDAAVAEVRSLLEKHPGVTVVRVSDGGELIRAKAPISTWESLLSAELHVYRHEDTLEDIVRAPDFLLPTAYQTHIDSILGIVDFELYRPHNLPGIEADSQAGRGPSWGYGSFEELKEAKSPGVMSPGLLRKVYNVPPVATRGSVLATRNGNTTQVVYATLGQYWSPSDRATFERSFHIPEDNYVRQLSGNGKSGDAICRADPNKCAEANLDVQYMMAMSPWAKIGYWYVPDADAKGMYNFLNEFMERFVDSDDAPHVISVSYGMPEFSVSRGALTLFEVLSMKLAARGVTILVASGDDGAASFLARKRVNGRTCWFMPMVGLQVSWPASSAWVTSVGSTIGAEIGEPQIVCQVNATGPSSKSAALPLITSGGGYSSALKRPAWQNSSHQNVGRGVPDMALAGHAFAVVIGGRWLTVDGTSASAPAVAGMLSLINSRLLEQGKPTIGFLNNMLYRNTSKDIFTDVTEGDNRCAAAGAACCGGYDAGPGWDPTTGLGTPDFKKLEAMILDHRGTHGNEIKNAFAVHAAEVAAALAANDSNASGNASDGAGSATSGPGNDDQDGDAKHAKHWYD